MSSLRLPVAASVLCTLFATAHAQTTIPYVDGENNPNPLVLDGANSPVSLSIDSGAATQSGVISEDGGSFGITKIGAGMLTLSAVNTYTGNTILDGGTLAYGVDNTIGALMFGPSPQSTITSSLDLTNASLTTTSLVVQTSNSTASPNTISIGSGKTLSVGGVVQVGTNPTSSTPVPTALTITGAGTFSVINTDDSNFIVGVGSGTNAFATMNVHMDMSGRSNFEFSTATGNLYVGYGTRPQATLRLANTSNIITAASIVVGNSGQTPGFPFGTNNNAGAPSNLFLGAGTNVLNVDNINLGFAKGVGRIQFETSTGSVVINGQAGAGSRANITVGQESSGSGSTALNQFLLAGHDANVLAGNLWVGVNAGSSGASNAVATFDTGTLDVDSFQLARHTSGSGPAVGTFFLGASVATASTTPIPNPSATGVLNVNTEFFLANQSVANDTTAGTFGIYGGTANINTDIIDNSSVAGAHTTTLTLAGGTLNMMDHAIGSVTAPITNVNLAAEAGQTATLSNLGGTGINGSGLTKNGDGTLILAGTNNYLGDTTVDGGTLAVSGTLPGTTAVTVNAGGSLRPVGTIQSPNLNVSGGDLSFDLGAGASQINVTGTAAFTGASTITVVAAPANTYTLLTAGTLAATPNPTLVAPTGTRQSFTLDFATANQIKLNVIGNVANLVWTNAAGTGLWNVQSAANWSNAGNPDQFFQGDHVTFNDANGGNYNVTIPAATTVQPGSVTVNTTATYTISGAGEIAGTAELTKSGAGTLTLLTDNTYSGATTINAGTLNVGDGGSVGTLGSGSVTNNGTLSFNRADDVTVANAISGTGAVQYLGAGATIITGANSYAGATAIQNGIVTATTNASLGATAGIVNISNGGTLDIGGNTTTNNVNFGAKQFNIEGAGVGGLGAIVNNAGANQQNAFQHIALTGDATIGVDTRYDIRGGSALLDLAGHTLTKEGVAHFGVVSGTITDGTIIVNAGNFALEGSTSAAAGTGKFVFNDGTRLQFFGTTGTVTRQMDFNGEVSVFNNQGSTSTFASPIALAGNVTFDSSSAASVTVYSGAITESGPDRALITAGPGTLQFNGTSNHSGATTVNAGTLVIGATGQMTATTGVSVQGGAVLINNGAVSGNATIAGTLGGSGGSIAGSVAVDPGASFVFNLGATQQALAIGGTFTESIDGSQYVVTLTDIGGIVLDQTYTLMTFASTDFEVSDFLLGDGLIEGDFILNGTNLQFQVTAIPEPGVVAMLAFGGAVIMLFRMRRRSRGPAAS
jgi:fibronectin-binding autotransporter adhesin